MIEIDGIYFASVPDLQEHLDDRRNDGDYIAPVADLGYCVCGCVFNIEEMARLNFKRGMCPDCGEENIAIDRAAPIEKEAH